MPATVEFSDDARRMLDDADERWVAEHGYLASNPLAEEAEDAGRSQVRILAVWYASRGENPPL